MPRALLTAGGYYRKERLKDEVSGPTGPQGEPGILADTLAHYVEFITGGALWKGKTGYSDDAAQGFWIGDDSGVAKLNFGDATHYLKWDGSGLTVSGAVLVNIPSGSDLSLQNWQFTGTFSATDSDTVSWTAGTLTFSNGETFSILAGTTGNMTAKNYIYFDKAVSETALNSTTNPVNTIGANRVLIGIAQNTGYSYAQFMIFGGSGGQSISGQDLIASSVTDAKISSLTISKLTAGSLAVETTIGVGGAIHSTNKSSYADTDAGFWIGIDGGAGKFNFGDATKYITWDGTILTVNGGIVTGLASGSEVGIQGWQLTSVFTVTDFDTVAWSSGTLTLSSGESFSINSGSTGNMTAKTYIYFNKAVSTTTLRTTTTASNAAGSGKILVAVAEDTTAEKGEAKYIVFGAGGQHNIDADDIVANSITANEIAANTITAGQIAAGTITADEIAANTITAGQIAAGTITATEIASFTITANEIAAGAITATGIAASAVTAEKIAAGAVTATGIAANTITASKISGSGFGNLEISAGTISLATGGAIFSGKTGYGGTAEGFWVGRDSGVPKLDIGNATSYMRWTGDALEISIDSTEALTVKSGGSIKVLSGGDIYVESTSTGVNLLRLGGNDYNDDALGITVDGSYRWDRCYGVAGTPTGAYSDFFQDENKIQLRVYRTPTGNVLARAWLWVGSLGSPLAEDGVGFGWQNTGGVVTINAAINSMDGSISTIGNLRADKNIRFQGLTGSPTGHDKFMSIGASGYVGYRTAAEARSDIGAARVKTGTYTGDGATTKAITGVGFQPKALLITQRPAAEAEYNVFLKLDQSWGDYAIMFASSYVGGWDNGINSLDSDGFTVDDNGADAHPNANGATYDYLAIG